MTQPSNVNTAGPAAAAAPRRQSHPMLIMLLLAALLLLFFSHPLVHGDGTAQLIYLDSLAGDGDLDLHNQAERFAAANTYHLFPSPHTGELVTAFPFGSAFLLAPFYWLAEWLTPLVPALHAHRDYFFVRQGLPLGYSLFASLGALLYTLAATWLSYQSARRVAAEWAAALAALACLIGTPLLYYATIEPLSTHVYGSLLLAAATWLWLRRGLQTPLHPVTALAIGLLLGLATLVRWQLWLYTLPAGLALLVWAMRQAQDRQRWLSVLAFTLGAGCFAGLCGLYFWRFFGSPLLIPSSQQSGASFIGIPLHFLSHVLFAAQNGWLSCSPVVLPALAGLAGIAGRRNGACQALAWIALGGIGLQLALNSSLYDWFGGWAFGQRRMSEAYPLLVIGLAWLLNQAGAWRRWLIGLVVLCMLFGLLLLVAHLYYTHASAHPEGGPWFTTLTYLLDPARWPHLLALWRDRYGPWAWPRPEL